MNQSEMTEKLKTMAEYSIVVRTLTLHNGFDPEKWPAHLRDDLYQRLGVVKVERIYLTNSDESEQRDFAGHKYNVAVLDKANAELKLELELKSKEIGRSEHRGNTVDYIYDKCANYGRQFDDLNSQLAAERTKSKNLANSVKWCLDQDWSFDNRGPVGVPKELEQAFKKYKSTPTKGGSSK